MANETKSSASGVPSGEPVAETPAASVIGWTVALAAVLPLLMGLHGDGTVYLAIGAGLALCGAVLIMVGRLGQRRSGPDLK